MTVPTAPIQDSRPSPIADERNEPYWTNAAERRFVLPRCTECGTWAAPPVTNCGHCLAQTFEWAPGAGTGTLYSFIEYRRAWTTDWTEHVPYLVGVVELTEGPRMVVGLQYDPDGQPPAVDSDLSVAFEPRGAQALVPVFGRDRGRP